MCRMAPMATRRCPKCASEVSDSHRVCHDCGFPLATRVEPPEEEAVLREAWEAMAIAIRGAGLQGEPEQPVRDRFLENMPLPMSAELLIREALECQRYFSEDLAAETAGPQARYRACLNRLEVLAVDQRELAPRIAVLERQLKVHRGRLLRSNFLVLAIVLGAIGALVGVGWLVVRAVAAILRAL